MTIVRTTATALPPFSYTREDIHAVSARWLRDSPHQRELFDRFVNSSHIAHRNFAQPLETITTISGPHERARHFEREGRTLLTNVVRSLLEGADVEAASIDHLIFTSCSAPTIPAIDVGLVDDLGFRRSLQRIPIYQHGCAGGVIGLALAFRLLKPGERAILAAVELCSLVYQANDVSGGNLVGSAIFGDGAAAVLFESGGTGLRFLGAQSYLVPESAYLMGYGIEDDGVHLRLDRGLPQALSQHAPPFVRDFLGAHHLTPQDVTWWLFHPGGVKVLSAFEEAFSIKRERSRWAWEVLEQHGNMSSASVLFVLDSFMRSGVAKSGDRICMLGVGPGLTIESVLFEQE